MDEQHLPPVLPTGSIPPPPPAAPFQYWVPPAPAASPAPPRAPGSTRADRATARPPARKRRHPARRSRIAAGVLSAGAFVGLVGCTALTGGDENGTTTPTTTPVDRTGDTSVGGGGRGYDEGREYESDDEGGGRVRRRGA